MKKEKKVRASTTRVPVEPQRVDDVLRALVHHKSLALMFEHLAEYAADAFRGNDARGPKKLLAMPNGTRCRAEIQDVLEVENLLRQMAFGARMKVARLSGAGVLVDRDVLVLDEPARAGVPVPPANEGVVDVPARTSESKTSR